MLKTPRARYEPGLTVLPTEGVALMLVAGASPGFDFMLVPGDNQFLHVFVLIADMQTKQRATKRLHGVTYQSPHLLVREYNELKRFNQKLFAPGNSRVQVGLTVTETTLISNPHLGSMCTNHPSNDQLACIERCIQQIAFDEKKVPCA